MFSLNPSFTSAIYSVATEVLEMILIVEGLYYVGVAAVAAAGFVYVCYCI